MTLKRITIIKFEILDNFTAKLLKTLKKETKTFEVRINLVIYYSSFFLEKQS